jgi:hypothetical protein
MRIRLAGVLGLALLLGAEGPFGHAGVPLGHVALPFGQTDPPARTDPEIAGAVDPLDGAAFFVLTTALDEARSSLDHRAPVHGRPAVPLGRAREAAPALSPAALPSRATPLPGVALRPRPPPAVLPQT